MSILSISLHQDSCGHFSMLEKFCNFIFCQVKSYMFFWHFFIYQFCLGVFFTPLFIFFLLCDFHYFISCFLVIFALHCYVFFGLFCLRKINDFLFLSNLDTFSFIFLWFLFEFLIFWFSFLTIIIFSFLYFNWCAWFCACFSIFAISLLLSLFLLWFFLRCILFTSFNYCAPLLLLIDILCFGFFALHYFFQNFCLFII